jgi:hypothetical protein
MAVQKTKRSGSRWKARHAIIPNARIIDLSFLDGDLLS